MLPSPPPFAPHPPHSQLPTFPPECPVPPPSTLFPRAVVGRMQHFCAAALLARPSLHLVWGHDSFVESACLLGGTCGHMLQCSGRRGAISGHGSSSCHHRVELPGSAAPPPRLLRLLLVAKCALPSPSAPRSLPHVQARVLQLTLALMTLFVLCSFLCFAMELGLAFASPTSTAEEARTTVGSTMAATNCTLNPYVCLIFHSHQPWAHHLQSSLCRCPDRRLDARFPTAHRRHSGLLSALDAGFVPAR